MKILLSHFFLVVSSLCWLALFACAPVNSHQIDTSVQTSLPVYFGHAEAPHAILLYTNPQCPPCRRTWPMMRELFALLNPSEVRIVILGRGFTPEGTRLMYAASLLAEASPSAGRALLDEIMTDPAALSGETWLTEALGRHGLSERSIQDPQKAERYMDGVNEVKQRYGLTHTPSLVVDQVVMREHSIEAILQQLVKH